MKDNRRGAVWWAFTLLIPLLAGAQQMKQQATSTRGPIFADPVSRLVGAYVASPAPGKLAAPKAAVVVSLSLTPGAAKEQLAARRGQDPKDLCQVLGPFRMMARPNITFEILRDAPNKLILLFEQNSWGNVRNIRLDAEPLPVVPGLRPLWNGDSVAKWEGETLVVSSTHFTNKTWLNEFAVVNSSKLQLTERLRLVEDGAYLEYQATAVDPEVLKAPASYKRYFKRTAKEIEEDNCFEHLSSATPSH